MKSIAIIMVNYNGIKYIGQDDLQKSIKEFVKTNYPMMKFYFVDNGSFDSSIKLVSKINKVNVIKFNSNYGFSGACQEAVKRIKADYYCLINNDDMPDNRNWLSELVVLEQDSQIGAVFSKKLKWSNPDKIDAEGLSINKAGFVTQLGEGSKDINSQENPREVLIWQTPVLIKSDVIRSLQGALFDKDFVILHDDTDSSLRIWLSGYKIYYVPKSRVRHKRSATMRNLDVKFIAYHGRKNIMQTIIKNYETQNLWWVLVTGFIYTLSIPFYLLKFRFDQAQATFRAICWIFWNFGHILKKRKVVQNKVRKIHDRKISYLMTKFSLHSLIFADKSWPK